MILYGITANVLKSNRREPSKILHSNHASIRRELRDVMDDESPLLNNDSLQSV